LFLNQKELEKNNKEIKKLLPLFNNKDKQEELLIKLEDNKSPKELNNIKHNIKLPKKLKLPPEEMLNYLDKFSYQPKLDSPSSSELEVLLNLIQEQQEFSDF
jgi:hypothetical protein